MGRRGVPPLPTPLKLLRGETREQRLNRHAPKPTGGKPIMPSGMTPRAQRVWRRQIAALGETGILTTVDGDSLRAYCEAVDRYIQAAELLAASPPLVEGQKGIVRNPLHQITRDNAMLMLQFARNLGFLPSAREGLHVNQESERDPLETWLERKA